MHISQLLYVGLQNECILNQIYVTLSDTLENNCLCISEVYLRVNVTNDIDTQVSRFLCFLHTCEINVILICIFFEETFLHENRHIKTKILQCPCALKLHFIQHVVTLGSFRTANCPFCAFFINQNKLIKCRTSKKLDLLGYVSVT